MLFWTKEEYEKFAESIKNKPNSYYAYPHYIIKTLNDCFTDVGEILNKMQ